MQQTKVCPICKLEKQDAIETDDRGERVTYKCARCGEFTITRTAKSVAQTRDIGAKLTCWIRDRNEGGSDKPEISTHNLNDIENSLPDYSPVQKQLLFLRNIERKSPYPGYSVQLVPEFDYPLAWADCEDELFYYVKALIERNLIKRTGTHLDKERPLLLAVEITPSGWNYLDENLRKPAITDQVFVAMSFSESLQSIWENSIRPAILDAGYKPYRIDAEPHIDRIDSKIIAEIKNSRFLVADVTGQKQGVYFEAGFALGLGLPVIWCVQKDDLKNVHFDTRQYNHVLWETGEDLREKLYYLICAIIGKNK